MTYTQELEFKLANAESKLKRMQETVIMMCENNCKLYNELEIERSKVKKDVAIGDLVYPRNN